MEVPVQSMNLSVGGNCDPLEHEMQGGATPGSDEISIREQCGQYGWGRWFGCALSNTIYRHGSTMLWAALIFTAVYMIILFLGIIAEAEIVEANASVIGAAAAYANAAYHQKCKSRGGCSKSCPYISEADPRVVICKQMNAIDTLYGQTKQAVFDDKELVNESLFKIPDVSVSTNPKDSTTLGTVKDTISTEWGMYISTEEEASREIGVLLGKIKDLDALYGNVDVINVDLMDAKNKAVSYGAAAVLRKNALVVASLTLNSQIMRKYVYDVSADKQKKITGYAEDSIKCFNAADAIKQTYLAMATSFSNGTAYDSALSDIVKPETTSQTILKCMAALLSLAQDSERELTRTISRFSMVSDVYNKSRNVVESFSNDLPGKMDADKVTTLIQNGDYETAIIKTALEPDLVSNHKKYVKDRLSFDSGGGIPSVRDDDNDVNPWVGLFGRPTYRKSNGTSADVSTQPLQSIPSDNPNDLTRKSALRLGTQTF